MMLVAWPVVEALAMPAHRPVLGAGVVFGDHDHQTGQHQPDAGGAEQPQRLKTSSAPGMVKVAGRNIQVTGTKATKAIAPGPTSPCRAPP